MECLPHSTVQSWYVASFCRGTFSTSHPRPREGTFLDHTFKSDYKVITDSEIAQKGPAQTLEGEYSLNDRLQNDVCTRSEQTSTTDTAATSPSAEICLFDSCEDDTDAICDDGHNDNADSKGDQLTYPRVYHCTQGEEENESDEDEDCNGNGDNCS